MIAAVELTRLFFSTYFGLKIPSLSIEIDSLLETTAIHIKIVLKNAVSN